MEAFEEQLTDCIGLTTLSDICVVLDEDDELEFLENTFFKLYAADEYVHDIYNTNKLCHFQNVWVSEGFEMVSLYEPVKMDKDTRDGVTELIRETAEGYLAEFIRDSDKDDTKYKCINDRALRPTLYKNSIELVMQ